MRHTTSLVLVTILVSLTAPSLEQLSAFAEHPSPTSARLTTMRERRERMRIKRICRRNANAAVCRASSSSLQSSLSSTPSSLSASSRSTASAPSSFSSVSSTSSLTSSQPTAVDTTKSILLLLGQRTRIAAVTFTPVRPSTVADAEVVFKRFVNSVTGVRVVNASGSVLLELQRRTGDTTDKRTWRGYSDPLLPRVVLTGAKPSTLYIEVLVDSLKGVGISGELAQLSEFSLTTQGDDGFPQYVSMPTDAVPIHQTTTARMGAIRSTLTTLETPAGKNVEIARLAVAGGTGSLKLQSVTFVVDRENVDLTNIRLGGATAAEQTVCGSSVEEGVLKISSDNLPASLVVPPTTLSLRADVALVNRATVGAIHFRPLVSGSPQQVGSIRWSDAWGPYDWIDASSPIDPLPSVRITKP